MTRKHFEEIAKDIRRQWEAIPSRFSNDPECVATARTTLRQTAVDLTYVFKTINTRFDRERFLTACGMGE